MKSARKLWVLGFKFTVGIIVYGIFIFGFSSHYLGLRFFSRTLAIVSAAFVFFYYWMSTIYGKVELGEKKTKPLFHTLALSLLVTNALTFLALRVMTIHDHFDIVKDLLMLLMVYVAQLVVSRMLIASGNSLYFVNYTPDRTLVISENDIYLDKILAYLESHKKQFKLLDVVKPTNINDISLMDVDKVFLLGVDNQFLSKLLEKGYLLDIEFYFTGDLFQALIGSSETYMVDDIMMYHYKTRKITDTQKTIKRLLDIAISSLAILVSAPIMLVIGILIKLDDGGPIIYSQDRLTENGRVFRIYKFRSMKQNSGDKPAQKEDDRITKVGKFIRKIRVDELPQLFNIIKGDMSIVGPRPESVTIAQEINKEVPEFGYRLKVKAGLTGTAQILGKYNTSSKEKLLMDIYYIENFSIFNDLRLMFQTLLVFIKKDSTEGFDK